MLRPFFLSALALALFIAPVPALATDDDAVVARSEITAVTVYTNRAKITRVATVDLPKGAQTVVFEGLPPILLPDSLRAEGSATAEVTFGAVAHKQVMSSDLTSERERELTEQLRTLQDRKQLLQARKQALAAQKQFIENIGKQAALRTNEEIAEMNLKPDQWAGAAKVILESMDNVLAAEVQENLKMRALHENINKVQREINQLRTGGRSTYQVTVPLEAASATTLTIELSYQVPNATWRPIYDARLSTEGKGDLALIQYGAVRQTTGEDWDGVNLTLSTAQPQRGASLPDLTPMWVDAYEQGRGYARPQVMSMTSVGGAAPGRASNMAMEESAAYDMVQQVPKEIKAQFAVAQIDTGGFVSEYKIPGPAKVLADGSETKLMVGAFDTSSIMQIHVKPQLSTDAFLVAKAKLKGESPVLPGQVNLFRDGAFVGQSSIPMLRPDEEHGFYFGVDDQVAVERKVMKDKRSETGLIARDNRLERLFLTEIQNLHTDAVEIVVKETVPTPKTEKVRLTIDEQTTTRGYETDAADIKGMLRWKFTMQPKSKQKLQLGWALSWPTDHQLSGLR